MSKCCLVPCFDLTKFEYQKCVLCKVWKPQYYEDYNPDDQRETYCTFLSSGVCNDCNNTINYMETCEYWKRKNICTLKDNGEWVYNA